MTSGFAVTTVYGSALFAGWFWRHLLQIVKTSELSDEAAADTVGMNLVQSVVHDGVLPLVEKVAADQVVTPDDRQRAIELSVMIRRQLLHDEVPRSTRRLLEKAFADAARDGIYLKLEDLVDEDPPVHILAVFSDALGALVLNLKHAAVMSARLQVSGDSEHFHVTLIDDGKGRSPEASWGPTTESRVVEGLKNIQGTAQFVTEPGYGVTWHLDWTRELQSA